ncbi:hypothetical protein L2K20_14250 [Mycobacterium sp. MBM]|nr:hypothetical protein [Mycobacterium sp. MBM]
MVDSDDEETANIAQARLLLRALWEQVDDVSRRIEDEEARVSRRPSGSPARAHRVNTAQLRRELYQLHGMIDGINRRFPQIAAGV